MKRMIYIICLMLLLTLLGGCGKVVQTDDGKDIIFMFDGENICIDEVYIYAQTTIEEYEQKYGNNIWNESIVTDDGLEVDAETTARKEVIANVVKTKVLVSKAEENGIYLTTEEIAEQEQSAEEFYSKLTDSQIEEMSIEKETIVRVLKENLLASKVYDYIMKDSDTEISDEAARMTTFYDMFFACYTEDGFGNVTVFSAEKIQSQKEKAEKAYNSIMAEKDNPDLNIAFLGYTYDLKYAGSHTMDREQIVSVYGQDTLDVLYSMKDGEISSVIETEYGYHIFQMTALTDKDATAENKAKLTEEVSKEYFNSKIEEWTLALDKNYSYSKRVNTENYNKIEFK